MSGEVYIYPSTTLFFAFNSGDYSNCKTTHFFCSLRQNILMRHYIFSSWLIFSRKIVRKIVSVTVLIIDSLLLDKKEMSVLAEGLQHNLFLFHTFLRTDSQFFEFILYEHGVHASKSMKCDSSSCVI